MVSDPAIGKADYFITMTCNPQWPEIQNQLQKRYHETAENSPDIVARVFRLKLKALMQEIKGEKGKDGIFGQLVGSVIAIEFQKRGLPHAHILLMMADKHKIKTPAQIDRCIEARIPNPKTQILENKTIVAHNIHRPCDKTSDCW